MHDTFTASDSVLPAYFPGLLLRMLRENIAVEYLTTTDKPTLEIALALGYNDLSNFGRAFKRWTGHPPSAYRQRPTP